MPESSSANALHFVTTFGFLSFCGCEANLWLEAFAANGAHLAADLFKIVVLLQKHDIETGGKRLAEIAHEIEVTTNHCPAIGPVLLRWYYTAEAYRLYLLADLDGARGALAEAQVSVVRLVAANPFMLPMAVHCTDFRIQSARIARRENRWSEAKRWLNEIRETYSDQHPFCVLNSGEKISMSRVRQFYQSLSLNEEELEKAKFALDPAYPHAEWIDRLEESIFALTDFVIPYS
jgi:hypothetical protein